MAVAVRDALTADVVTVLKARGYKVLVSAVGDAARNVFEIGFEEKTALVFGNERFGVSEEVKQLADGLFWIPMTGFTQSFNISVSVASTLATPSELTALSVKRGLLEQLVQNPPKEFQHQRERDSEKRQLRFRWLLLEAYLHCVSPFRSGIDERAEI